MSPYKIELEITKILEAGDCPIGHKVGDKFSYPEDIGKLCPAALNSIYPYIRIMESGGSYPWFEEPNSQSFCCPDYKRPVVFKISRTEIES
jgi:uncharacterized repeat protein (TIGR04076 family)